MMKERMMVCVREGVIHGLNELLNISKYVYVYTDRTRAEILLHK